MFFAYVYIFALVDFFLSYLCMSAIYLTAFLVFGAITLLNYFHLIRPFRIFIYLEAFLFGVLLAFGFSGQLYCAVEIVDYIIVIVQTLCGMLFFVWQTLTKSEKTAE